MDKCDECEGCKRCHDTGRIRCSYKIDCQHCDGYDDKEKRL